MEIRLFQFTNISFGTKKQFKRLFPVCSYSGETFRPQDTATFEHIVPTNRSGTNDLSNKIVVKRSWNGLRSDIPLGEFIGRYPQVKDNIIKAVQRLEGRIIDGINWAEDVKKTLTKEIGYDIFSN